MILYHGSNSEITLINLDKCKPYKDFGRGFYLTTIETQAVQMAKRTTTIFGGVPNVITFEFDYIGAMADKAIKIKKFDEPNREWALFIMANRSRDLVHPIHNYDIVIGPVADDTIATLFRNFDDGVIDIDMLVSRLKYKKVSSQYLFHSLSSLKYLKQL